MNYQITCFCGHRFFVTEQQVSAAVTCPNCKRHLQPVVSHPDPVEGAPQVPALAAEGASSIPTPAPAPTEAAPPPPPAEPTKRCPFCGEVILAIAKKCKHCGEFLDHAHVPGAAGRTSDPAPADQPPVFALSVSQWDNFWKYVICITIVLLVSGTLIALKVRQDYAMLGISIALVLAAFTAWFFYLSARHARCFIRPNRIDTETGILSKDLNSIEIFRITDMELKQGIIQRLLRIGSIRITSTDPNTPELILYQIPRARQVYKYLQNQIPIATRQRGALFVEK